MGQWLSIPFILLGCFMIYRAFIRPAVEPAADRKHATAK